MLSLSLGPIALPLAPFLLLIAIWGSSWLASRRARQGADKVPGEQAGRTVTHAALLGLVAARLAYLVWHADAYLASPWAAFDLRDGGWSASAGLVAGVAWLAWRGLVTPWLRRPLAVSGAAGVAFWWLATLASGLAGTHSLPPPFNWFGSRMHGCSASPRLRAGVQWWSICGPAGAVLAGRKCRRWRPLSSENLRWPFFSSTRANYPPRCKAFCRNRVSPCAR